LQIIAICNTKGRVCLNAYNKDWLKNFAKRSPRQIKWEIQNINNNPYHTALGPGQHSGLCKFAKRSPRQIKWEIQNINNNPYHTALGPGQHSGLNKMNKLPNDHPQGASEGPDI
jgi:hypothetical protein